ncbi:MAG: acyl-ACP--UDP-N-acetylglucosamine O-acyltransferase, partial [Planctomycetales bacterium]|nr:acyl-ACP--UDP-N-acetylglucosamine O-acyltransferase [Planctomycetales bacterium]
MAIHPTAIVSPKAEIASGVDIGPYCVVEANVKIGSGTRLHGRAHIFEHTEMGRDNEVHDGAILGNVPQDRAFKGAVSHVRIGDRNVFREGSWIHRGSAEGSATVIGNDNYLMGFAHVAHNCTLGDRVTLASNTLLAGHTTVEDRVFVSANVIVHQFSRIGQGAFVSG